MFPISNRGQDVTSDFSRLVNSDGLRQGLADFHALVFVAGMGVLGPDGLDLVANAVVNGDLDGLKGHEAWRNLVALVEASNGSGKSVGASQKVWACRHCTYENRGEGSCEMCGLPDE